MADAGVGADAVLGAAALPFSAAAAPLEDDVAAPFVEAVDAAGVAADALAPAWAGVEAPDSAVAPEAPAADAGAGAGVGATACVAGCAAAILRIWLQNRCSRTAFACACAATSASAASTLGINFCSVPNLLTRVDRMRASSWRPNESSRLSLWKVLSTRFSSSRTLVVCMVMGSVGSWMLRLNEWMTLDSCSSVSVCRTWCTRSARVEYASGRSVCECTWAGRDGAHG